MRRITTYALHALILAIALNLPAATLAAKLYKWTDTNGNTYYSDKVPPEHSKSARSEMDDRGIEVNKVDAAKTTEEIRREKELAKLRAEQQRLIEQQRAKDRVLLRTFRTEDDILMARNGKLTAVDVMIQVARSNIRRMKFKLAEMQQSAAQMERSGKHINPQLLQIIESTRQQLKESYEAIISKEQKKELIRQKAGEDIARFRKLKKLDEENNRIVPEQKERFSLLDTVVICNNDRDCNRAWDAAERYVRKNATTRLQILSKSIIMTAAPVNDDDITITISRITKESITGAKLFMDVQCKDSPRGKDLCQSEALEKIRKGFGITLGQALMNR